MHIGLIERMSLVITFLGFHHVLIVATLGHIPYLLRSLGVYLFVHTFLIERMNLVMTFLGFHHVLIDCHTREYPLSFEIIRSLFVYTYNPYREDESCYNIFGISSCFDRYHIGAYPLSFEII